MNDNGKETWDHIGAPVGRVLAKMAAEIERQNPQPVPPPSPPANQNRREARRKSAWCLWVQELETAATGKRQENDDRFSEEVWCEDVEGIRLSPSRVR